MSVINSLNKFVAEGEWLTSLIRPGEKIEDSDLHGFVECWQKLDFFADIVDRAATLIQCLNNLQKLTDDWKQLQDQIGNLPNDPGRSNVKSIPREMQNEENCWMRNVDIQSSFLYYEVTSIVALIKQLGVTIDDLPELLFLVKVRDRFLFHGQLRGVKRGFRRGFCIPLEGDWQVVARSIIGLSQWSSEELRLLGTRAVKIGSPEWRMLQNQNELLILSNKHNERFTPDEITDLRAAGVRECDIEKAMNELGKALESSVLPMIKAHSECAMQKYKFESWPEEAWERWPDGY